jgi:hypothetical protein
VLSLLCYSNIHKLWHPTLAPPFHETPRSDVDFSPRILATHDFMSFNVELPCSYLTNPQNYELLYSPGPQHSCRPSPLWHVVRSGGSMSPSATSSGPTTLPCLLDSLARGMHSCSRVHSKKGIQWSNPLLRSMTQIFSAFQGFEHREFIHPTSRTSICRNPKITVY